MKDKEKIQKIMIISIICISIIIISLIAYSLNTSNSSQDIESDEIQESTSEFESASTEIGKSIEEAEEEYETASVSTDEENSTNNTANNTSTNSSSNNVASNTTKSEDEETAENEDEDTSSEEEVEETEGEVEESETEESTNELEEKLKTLEDKTKDLEKQVNDWKTDYYKVFADMENTKKRLEKEHNNQLKYMLQSFIEDLLPVLDNFERSLNVSDPSEEVSNFLKGNQMIYNQLMEILKKHGVEVIEAEGKPFDPNFHQAVMMVNDENYESGVVVEELQKGYKLKDRVIRATLVKVNE